MKKLLAVFIFLFASTSYAGVIVIDPDDYDDGIDLTSISDHVSLKTTSGGSVYAASLAETAANGKHTQGLGKKVFGGGGWGNEWFYTPDLGGVGLEIRFNALVTHCSLLIGELFFDAGPGSDPVQAYIFDKNDNLISLLDVDEHHKRVDLGFVEEGLDLTWAHWTFEFSAANIGRIVIGGNSEPTTLDRLEFTLAEVPEPGSLALVLAGFLFLLSVRAARSNLR